jgi:hypothetical protein
MAETTPFAHFLIVEAAVLVPGAFGDALTITGLYCS